MIAPKRHWLTPSVDHPTAFPYELALLATLAAVGPTTARGLRAADGYRKSAGCVGTVLHRLCKLGLVRVVGTAERSCPPRRWVRVYEAVP